ncbi:MAG: glycogen/starch synthase [Actinomycetota bacterium]
MRILYATAEIRPLVSAGGLGEASAGLVKGLRSLGHEVDVVLPDYFGWSLANESELTVSVPTWAHPTRVRRGDHPDVERLILVDGPGIARPDPYVDADGNGWPDNDLRFAAFSAAVAALVETGLYDVVQLNDWHTGLVPAFTGSAVPTVLTIHNLAHQGWADVGWLHELPSRRDDYGRNDALNMLAGAIRSVDAVVTVSPTYAREVITTEGGMGLHDLLQARGDDLIGIRNGIDTAVWNPAIDMVLPATYDAAGTDGKVKARSALLRHMGWDDEKSTLIVMITRLVDQKGVDLALEAVPYLRGMRARMALLGSGDAALAADAHALAAANPDVFWFSEGYDVDLSHLMFAGGDLLLMPSRFEPCGLAQMQAMAYGTIPVVTSVGGLCDTVIDSDDDKAGNGFRTRRTDAAGVVDALHRAVNAWRHPGRRRKIMDRGMRTDWSWERPATDFAELYARLAAR